MTSFTVRSIATAARKLLTSPRSTGRKPALELLRLEGRAVQNAVPAFLPTFGEVFHVAYNPDAAPEIAIPITDIGYDPDSHFGIISTVKIGGSNDRGGWDTEQYDGVQHLLGFSGAVGSTHTYRITLGDGDSHTEPLPSRVITLITDPAGTVPPTTPPVVPPVAPPTTPPVVPPTVPPVSPPTVPHFMTFDTIAVADGNTVTLYRDNVVLKSFVGMPGLPAQVGVRVTQGDMNGDGVPELGILAGPGAKSLYYVLDGATGASYIPLTQAFEDGFLGGLFGSMGDVNGDGFSEFGISPDEGGGPRGQLIDGLTRTKTMDAFIIPDTSFRGGMRMFLGDINGDGKAEVGGAAGFAGGPRNTIIDGAGVYSGRFVIVLDTFTFNPALRNGTFGSVVDLNLDGYGDFVTVAGPGGSSHISVYSGVNIARDGTLVPLYNRIVGNPDARDGATTAAAFDLNRDGFGGFAYTSRNGGQVRVGVIEADGHDGFIETFGLDVASRSVFVG